MKKIIAAIAFAALGASVTTSCSDFLDVKMQGNPSEDNYWHSDKQAMDAVAAVYWVLSFEETWGRDLFWEQGCGDDMVCNKSRWPSLYEFHYTGDESPLVDNWKYMYEYMARANWVISSLKAKGMDNLTAIEKRSVGEALFMRAWLHFHIAYRYGRSDNGVPFIRYEDSPEYAAQGNSAIPPQCKSVLDNYALIEQDLKEAEGLLPLFQTYGAEDQGRAHKQAVWALMVKLYAYWSYWSETTVPGLKVADANKWDLIPPLVDKLENEGGRGLLDNFADVFKMENNWSKEYIWSVTSTGPTEGGSIFPGICLVVKGWGLYNGWGSLKPTRGLYEAFDKNDKRRDVSLIGYGRTVTYFGADQKYNDFDAIKSGFMYGKYFEPYTYGKRVMNADGELDAAATAASNPYINQNGNRPTTSLNLPLIRFAEMVLFKAEALIKTGDLAGAANELNRLRRRAGLSDLAVGDKDSMMKALMKERRCELSGEFTDRFMDLKRWEDYKTLNSYQYAKLPKDPSKPLGDDNPFLADNDPANKAIWPVTENAPLYSERETAAPGRHFEPEYDLVFPFPSQEVIKANGRLKQNPIGK